MQPISRRSFQNEHAQGMVEFALVLPVLLMLVLGSMEVGRMLFIYSAVASASREAARYGSAAGLNAGGIPRFQDCAGIRASAIRIGGLAGVENTGTGINIQYDDGNPANILGTCPVGGHGPGLAITGSRIVVSIAAQYRPLIPLGLIRPFTINSVSTRTIIKDIPVGPALPPVVGPLTVRFSSSGQSAPEDTDKVTLTVRLSGVAPSAVTVPYSVGGTAVQGADYQLTPGSQVVIPAGSTTAAITFTIVDDSLFEDAETVELVMGTPVNAVAGTPDHFTLTILDNDIPPLVSFASASQAQGETAGSFPVELQLNGPSGKPVRVTFSLSGAGTATEGDDFSVVTSPRELTIPAGDTSASLWMNILDDSLDEDDETIVLTLGTPENGTLAVPDTHTATIIDNDTATVSFVLASQKVAEAAGQLDIDVQLSTPSTKAVSVPFSISGTATLYDDYAVLTASPLSFPPGVTSASITIDLNEDDIPEEEETIVVTLGTPTEAGLGAPATHTATLTGRPTVWFMSSEQTVPEGAGNVEIVLKLIPPVDEEVSVPFTLSGTAISGQDFSLLASPITIPAGSRSARLIVNLINDARYELDETMIVTLGNPTNALRGAPFVHTVTITNDDPQPTVSFVTAASAITETDAGSAISITLQLSAESIEAVSVPFNLSGSAVQGLDFTLTPSPVVIPAGSRSGTIYFNLIDDTQVEGEETVIITMGEPVNALKGSPAEHALTIFDNDHPVCSLSTDAELNVESGNKRLSWVVTNLGMADHYLGTAYIVWPIDPLVPEQSPKLSLIKYGAGIDAGFDLWSGMKEASPVLIDLADWTDYDESHRRLEKTPSPSSTRTITFKFTQPLVSGKYQVALSFYFYDASGNRIDCMSVETAYTLP